MLLQTCALDLRLPWMPSQSTSFSAHLCSTSCWLDAWSTLGFLLYQNPGMALGPMFQINTSGGTGQTDYLLGWAACPLTAQASQQEWLGSIFYFIYFFFWILDLLTTSSSCNINSILPFLKRVTVSCELGSRWLTKKGYLCSFHSLGVHPCTCWGGNLLPTSSEGICEATGLW